MKCKEKNKRGQLLQISVRGDVTTEEKPTKFDVAGVLDGGGSECGEPPEAGKGEKSLQTGAWPADPFMLALMKLVRFLTYRTVK